MNLSFKALKNLKALKLFISICRTLFNRVFFNLHANKITFDQFLFCFNFPNPIIIVIIPAQSEVLALNMLFLLADVYNLLCGF